ncbi:MAG: hypothetical protein NTU73_08315 [Ignavibacteriae bacterium]|nr:hypothetical protein [Ignavibacteriota bacterium]
MKLEFFITPKVHKSLHALKDREIKSVAVGTNRTSQRCISIKIEIPGITTKKKQKKH